VNLEWWVSIAKLINYFAATSEDDRANMPDIVSLLLSK